ncbi:MAG: glycerol-3-phosphate dehydrogenase [Deltaproteobacteria bacterium]|nr:MAG: glycerol-3-phosphate dehydrogenase [Deltaproteobacteria bacterium]
MDRKESVAALQAGSVFDILVVGGGATGSGIALDAASRGLKTALVEMRDFAEGTSSRSTKMVHGGVRYLEKAVKRLDREQWELVKEGLHERGIFLKNAPHLAAPLFFVTPLYSWIDVPQVFIGLKLYDWLSGKWSLGASSFLSKKEVLARFPMVNEKKLKGGVSYYDGQFNDVRMTLYLLKTAAKEGAVIANHLEVVDLLKEEGKVVGALAKDCLTGEEFNIKARCVVNATGPFTDGLRKMDEPDAEEMLKVSSGIHIVLDKRFAPPETGLMIPETEDGRVLFVIPWENHAIIGTTDEPDRVRERPEVSEEDIDYVLRHINNYFTMGVTRADIKAVWSGLRPLVMDPDKENTQELARNHVMVKNSSGLVTISGGKWTSYRRMAEELVDMVVKEFSLTHAGECRTKELPIVGGAAYSADGFKHLVDTFSLEEDIAVHLNRFYGDQAAELAELAKNEGYGARVHQDYPYIEAEIIHAVRKDMAIHAADMLIRRLPLGLLDFAASKEAADRVITLMAQETGWDAEMQAAEKALLLERLDKAV